jgi:hypothetical protein
VYNLLRSPVRNMRINWTNMESTSIIVRQKKNLRVFVNVVRFIVILICCDKKNVTEAIV